MSQFSHTLQDGHRVLKAAALDNIVPELRAYGFTYEELEQLLSHWTDPSGCSHALNLYDRLDNAERKGVTPCPTP